MNWETIKSKIEEQSKIFLILLTVIGFIIGLFFVTSRIKVEPDQAIKLSRPPRVEISFLVFESEDFQKLEIFEGSAEPEEKGREEPFEPYVVEEEEEVEEEEVEEEEVEEETNEADQMEEEAPPLEEMEETEEMEEELFEPEPFHEEPI